jgi:Mrp family chromosome partitioning ATPase
VIVDTSPVNVVSEAAVVAAHADASIFVMQERGTSLRQALAALRRIGNHKVRPIGLVVNRSQIFNFPRPEAERSRSEFDRASNQEKTGLGVG